MLRLAFLGASSVLLLSLVVCGGTSNDAGSSAKDATSGSGSRPSGNGACGLLTQVEVDEMFGTSVGAGADETLEGGVQICSWPAGDSPGLLLQISEGTSEIRSAVDLGSGYRVADVDGMSGPAATAIEQSDGPEVVVVFALSGDGKTITVSPVGIAIQPESPEFESLKALAEQIASRL